MSETATAGATAGPAEIWTGVYPGFDEAAVGVVGPGFDGDIWRSRLLASAQASREALERGIPIPQLQKQRSLLLPPVAAMLLARRRTVRVLDFGGGLGIGYMVLAESLPDVGAHVHYTVVDVAGVCDEGRRLWPGVIEFMTDLPAADRFDLVHAASALQYVRDWKALLLKLGSYGAEYMLLSDVFAGAIPTFVTLQNYYDSRIRHWFWNLDELLAACSAAGYTLAMRAFAGSRRLGVDDDIPMSGFPASHRLQQSLHLLLRRNG